jgi:transcriptional regulator with XRE-family HTH domain
MSSDTISTAIKKELGRRRMSRAALAAAVNISLSAMEKGLSGDRKFSDAVLAQIENVLGLTLRESIDSSAPDALGGYARAAVSWLEGNYLTIRPSPRRKHVLYTYATHVSWNDERNVLVFKETARLDKAYAQAGDVSVPHQSGHIYFVTNAHGQYRMAVMKRQPMTGEMFGLLLTLQKETGVRLKPVTMPVVMVPMLSLKQAPMLGVVSEANRAYAEYSAKLAMVLEEGFAGVLGV